MIHALSVWWWKWRFTEALLKDVAKERNGLTIRFCEACADDAWHYVLNIENAGDVAKALTNRPSVCAKSFTKGTLSSFRIPARVDSRTGGK